MIIITLQECNVVTGLCIHLEEDLLTSQSHALKRQVFRPLLVALFTAKRSTPSHDQFCQMTGDSKWWGEEDDYSLVTL